MPTVRLSGAEGSEGKIIQVNSLDGIPFETDVFSGQVLFLQRPTPEPFHDNWPYAKHFRPIQRRWEMRCQGKFKKLVDAEGVYFGAEFKHDTSLSWSKLQVAKWVLKMAEMLAAAKGVWFHHALALTRTQDGSMVLPHYVSPMCAAEALYATPPGEEPPPITEPIAWRPLSEKKSIEVNTQDTFTIALWNKQLDFATWQICNLGFGWKSSITPYIGDQPIHLVAYSLKQKDVPGDPHTEANKDYILRLEVSPPPTVDAGCNPSRGQAGVVFGRAAASFYETAEKVAPRALASALPAGDGQDLRPSRFQRYFAWCAKFCAWCK